MKKTVSLLAAFAVVTCMIMVEKGACGQAFAAEEQNSGVSTVDEIAKQFGDPSNDPFDYTGKAERAKALKKADREYPERFDLRNVDTDGDGIGDTSYVTPVKSQYPFGTCWGFAAISAAETSILSDPKLNEGLTAEKFDLSEKHLAYFAMTALDAPGDPQNGEGIHIGSVQERLDRGGASMTATSMFSSGVGPVLESCGEEYKYRGAKGLTEKAWIDGKYQNVHYLADDDWSLPESLRFTQSYVLRDSCRLPSPAGEKRVGSSTEYEYDPAGTAAIKEQLLQYRAVQIGYLSDTFDPDVSDHGEYLSSQWAQYTPIDATANHAVCIVGWDDNYDRSNFIERQEPPANGAWLVKNSWGSEEEAFPNHGEGNWGIVDPQTGKHTGYFWLSYYDKTMNVPETLAFDAKDAGTLKCLDQYDLMPVDQTRAAAVGSEVRMANIFRPDTCEKIEGLSCQTTYPETEVTYEVYLLQDEYNSPTDGIRMAAEKEVYQYGGYHKVSLKDPFIVMKDQPYAIVVTQKTRENKYAVSVQTGLNLNGSKDPALAGIVNEGESFVLLDGKWQDFSDKKLQKSLMAKVAKGVKNAPIDNFPLKAYGEELPNLSMTLGESGNVDITEPGLDQMYLYLSLRFKGDLDIEPGDVETTWTLAEGGDQMVEMKDGRDPSRKVLRGKKCGRTRLIVTAQGIGTLIYSIDISPSMAEIVKLTPGKKKLTLATEDLLWRGIDGYQVKYRIKGKKTWKVKEFAPSKVRQSGNKDILVLKNLKKGQRYQVKVRAWANTPEGRYYGVFSPAKVSKKIK